MRIDPETREQIPDEQAPPYPPAIITICIPLDDEPYIDNDGGLGDWLIASACAHLARVIRDNATEDLEEEDDV